VETANRQQQAKTCSRKMYVWADDFVLVANQDLAQGKLRGLRGCAHHS
jgi:hypothetical protein